MNDRLAAVIWSVGLFIVILNTAMFNVTIPVIIQDLAITPKQGALIISCYSIGYALSSMIYSRLSDMLSLWKLSAFGLLVLFASSILGLFAHDFLFLLTSRILQSTGSGVIVGLGVVVISRYVPYERRGRSLAILSAGGSFGFGIGPLVGGIIGQYFGWNSLFYVPALVIFLLPFLWRLLPKEEKKPVYFDVIGAFLTFAHVVSLMFAIMQLSLLWLTCFVLSICAHVAYLRRAKDSFIKAELFKSSTYRKLAYVSFSQTFIVMGVLFVLSLALSELYGLSVLGIGLFIAPGAILSVSLTYMIGKSVDKYGNLKVSLCGLLLCIVILVVIVFSLNASSIWVLFLGNLFLGSVLTTINVSVRNEISRILPKEWIGTGMGLSQMLQFIGGSIATTACGLILEQDWAVFGLNEYQCAIVMMVGVSLISLVVFGNYLEQNKKQTTASLEV